MTLINTFPFFYFKTKHPKQVLSTTWDDRTSINQKDVNLFCWERPEEPAIKDYLNTLVDTNLPAIRLFIDKENIDKQLVGARNIWDRDKKHEGDAFWKDVQQVAKDFLHFSEDSTGVFHLKVVANDACKKFHIDGYRLRLFSTYIGPGTEWLPEAAVNRNALGTTNEQIVTDYTKIQRLGTGHVSILKGELPFEAQSVKGIVHRSPEITSLGEKRIILRVDI
ncbi:MAG: DUF1826 domain-containing protein [Fulvivirga sp.]